MIGQRVGKYRVIREIGRGGMGLVYEAQHETMPRLRAAIKVLHASATTEEYQRLEREARVLSSLQDSGIVRLEDFGSLDNGRLYLRMEYLEGETLDHRLGRLGRLPGRQALELARQMATTLSRIHAEHILHRDLKPANIMIIRDSQADGGELARLLDFGIAKLLRSEQWHSITLQPMGTPLYMSPEQGDAKATLTDRSDVYQLGLVLYEMLSGAVPYEVSADSLPIALHIQRLTEPPTPLRQHLPGLPSAVADLVDAMLQRSPAARPSMATIAQRLKQLLSELPSKVDWKRSARSLLPALPSRAPSQASRETLGFGSESRREISDLTAELTPQSLSARVWGPLSESGWGRWLHTSGRRRLPGLLALLMAIFLSSPLPVGRTSESRLHSGASVLGSGPDMDPVPEPGPASPVTPVGSEPQLPWQKLDCARQPKVEGMACIPGGVFTPGLTQAEAAEHERSCLLGEAPERCEKDYYARQINDRSVLVPTFHLDQFEVNNAQFARYLNAALKNRLAKVEGIFVYLEKTPTAALKSGGALVYEGGRVLVRPGQERRPVGYVTWYGAQSYCQGRGAHLPTEAEWEYAARGSERRAYPWGAEPPTCQGVAFGRDEGLPCGVERGARDVGTSVQDLTPEGVADLAGNSQEWVANHFSLHLPLSCHDGICFDDGRSRPLPQVAGEHAARSVRGGTWISGKSQLYAAWRSRWEAHMADVSLGFRCAATIEPLPTP
mgnify:CR=1 FL=1